MQSWPVVLVGILFFLVFSVTGISSGLGLPLALPLGLLALVIGLMSGLYFLGLAKIRLPRSSFGLLVPAALMVITFVFAAIRANSSTDSVVTDRAHSDEVYYILCLTTAALSGMFITAIRKFDGASALEKAMFFALGFLCFTQIVLLIMGIKNKLTDDLPSLQTEAQALSLLGLHVQRFIPAISTNVNGAAVAPMAVISLAALRKPRSKSITIGLAAISLFLLLLIDAKSFAIAAFAALGLFTLFRSFPSVLATIAVVIPALPPAITLSKDFLWLSFLDQRKSYYGMFTGREHIWDGFWAVWLKADDFHRFFGYGLLGQNTSGMYLKYKDMFTDYQTITKTTATLHNSYLQILADTGIFGLTINMLLLWVLVRTAAAWAKNGEESNVWGAFTVLTISLAIAAGTEVALTVYMRESFALYIFLIVAVLTLRSAKRENAGRASIRRP